MCKSACNSCCWLKLGRYYSLEINHSCVYTACTRVMILTPLPAWNFSLCSLDSSWPQEVVSVCVLYEALLRNVSIVLQCSVIFHAFSYSVTLWKACGLLQDLTDTIACLSISRFSKVACLIHKAAFHFCSPHVVEYLHLRWVYPCSPPLFVWLVQYTTRKWTNGQIRKQDGIC